MVYWSRGMRSRDINFLAMFSGQTKLVYRSTDDGSNYINFPAKSSGETKLVFSSRDVSFPAKLNGEPELVCIGLVKSNHVTLICPPNLAEKLNYCLGQ